MNMRIARVAMFGMLEMMMFHVGQRMAHVLFAAGQQRANPDGVVPPRLYRCLTME